MAIAEANVKMVPFNSIRVVEDANSRRALRDIPELTKSIGENGLKSALLVTNGGDDKHPYTLVAGYRRHAALSALKWGSKLVPVIIEDKDEDAVVSNLIENVERDDLHPLDLAEQLYKMHNGTYVVTKGEPRKWEKKELCGRLAMAPQTLNNYLRLFDKITPETGRLLRILFAWAMIEDPEEQFNTAQAWVTAQEEAAESGEAGDGDKGKPGKRKRSTSADKNNQQYAELGLLRNKSNYESVEDAFKVYKHLAAKAKGTEAAELEGKAEVLRWVMGKMKWAPGLTQEDYDTVFPPEEKKADKKSAKKDE